MRIYPVQTLGLAMGIQIGPSPALPEGIMQEAVRPLLVRQTMICITGWPGPWQSAWCRAQVWKHRKAWLTNPATHHSVCLATPQLNSGKHLLTATADYKSHTPVCVFLYHPFWTLSGPRRPLADPKLGQHT